MGRRLFIRVLPRKLFSDRPRSPSADDAGRYSTAAKLPRRKVHRRIRRRIASPRRRRVAKRARRAVEVADAMTATIIAILSLTVLGIPIGLAIDRRARGPLLIGTAFLYGSGTMFLVLLALSVAHIRWTLMSVTIASLLIFCAAAFVKRRGEPSPERTKPHLLDLVTLFTLVCYALYATLAAVWEWDFWAIWGLKARTFLEIGAIDWHFLESPWNTFAHPDYPLLVPLNYDFAALLNGGWNDRWLGLFGVAWAVALALVARALAARETTTFFASLLTLLVAALDFS